MRKVVLFILCLVCFSLVKVEAQIVNSSDTTIIRPKAPSRPELFCAFDEMSSEIIITPCTYYDNAEYSANTADYWTVRYLDGNTGQWVNQTYKYNVNMYYNFRSNGQPETAL